VTLLVSPDDAARLDLGQNKGTLHLTLRNPLDTERTTTRRATLKEIGLYEEPPPAKEVAPSPPVVEAPSAPPPPPPPPLAIRTIRGTQEGAVLIYPGGAR